ncbi:MAG: riboflavin synthase [Rhodospirillaceae bacterium]|nr:riboflavin synthase [Rhodospirillaceae bacterium]MYB13513.1 riboflavin synthase [Rhodospirillaceae bacterium]MYI49863.1 riboflavin synthase [Rhodospirillaceae bacterium]
MFTGIVTDIGRIRRRTRPAGGDTRFEIGTAYDTTGVAIGASIACSGVCLTVVETGPDWFAVQASDETLSCTTLGDWREGRRINLERALRAQDELGGHIVAGHVDTVGRVESREPASGSEVFGFAVDRAVSRYIAPKGSVAVDGVSLTVNAVKDGADTRFFVNLIPHTLTVTTLGDLQQGGAINLEVDLMARYVQRMLAFESASGESSA